MDMDKFHLFLFTHYHETACVNMGSLPMQSYGPLKVGDFILFGFRAYSDYFLFRLFLFIIVIIVLCLNEAVITIIALLQIPL